jgi:hypothetical protein
MKRILFLMISAGLFLSSCDWIHYKRVKGNDQLSSETRSVNHAERLSLSGSFNVEITQDATTSVKVEADANLLPYIETDVEDGVLQIRPRRHYSLQSEHPITIYITTPKLEQVHIAGSGSVNGKNKFSGGDHLSLKISGSGDIQLDINTPEITASISGSGDMRLSGETRKQTVKIAGQGEYIAQELKSEDAKINIAGSGDIRVFADNNLDVSIAGSGTVLYKGSPQVKQHVAGSGEIKKIE